MTELPKLARARWLREPGLTAVFAAIASAGGEARVAGGAVRNALLGEPLADIDLATTLEPSQVTAACEAAGMKVVPTGVDHGTVTVISGGRPYEVTTLRRDVETDGRRAKVKFTDDWQADALRRDFTMNALFCDARGKVYDFTGGYRDIQRKRVIFVGSPAKRIGEDYLRILRFFRFHARYGRGAPDRAGLAACARLRRGLDGLSAERLRQELLRLIVAPRAVATLKLMAKQRILERILPHIADWRVLSRLPPDPILRLAVLAREPEGLRDRLRLSNAEAARIERLQFYLPPSPALRPREQRIVLYQIGAETWRDLVQVAWARSRAPLEDVSWKRLLNLPKRWRQPQFPLGGHDLIASGLAPGPEMGIILGRLEDWWAAGDFKATKDELMAKGRSL